MAIAPALSVTTLVADDHSVSFDEDVDFSTFKTFLIRDGRMRSDRSELNFPAVMSALRDAIEDGPVRRKWISLKRHS